MKRIFFPALLLPLAALFFGCPDTPGVIDAKDIVFPEDDVSYSQHVQPLLAANCTFSGCHGINNHPQAMPFYDYYTLMEVGAIGYINPGNPKSSLIMQVIEYKLQYIQAHYRQWNINENQRNGVETWIEEGAQNN